MLKVTIITPSYNQGEYLEATIQSILNQNYPNLEYLIVDGGSTDNSVDIIRSYDEQLHFWVSEKDKGQSEAINKGFKIATGDIVTWVNSDDELLPNTLFKVNQFFEANPEIDLIHGNTILKWSNGKEIIKKCDKNDLDLKYFAGMPFSQPSAFFTKKIMRKVGYLNEDLHYGMDYDFFLRIALVGQIEHVDDCFSKYLIHSKSKTSSGSLLFAKEWGDLFCQFLNSLDNGHALVKDILSLNLGFRSPELKRSKVNKSFPNQVLQAIFCYHLYNQIVFRYEGGDLTGVRRITSFLKLNYPLFFSENRLMREHFRSFLLNKRALFFVRRLIQRKKMEYFRNKQLSIFFQRWD